MDSVNFGFRPLKSFCAPSFFRSLYCHSFLGGGGSCRRQGKSAAPRGRACGASLGSVWVGGRSSKGVVNIGTGQGLGCGPSAPGLGFFNEKEASGGGGRLGALGAVSSFVREGARWPVRSDNPYSKCGGAWRDKGPKLRFWLEGW